jgi:hypothetical protein
MPTNVAPIPSKSKKWVEIHLISEKHIVAKKRR